MSNHSIMHENNVLYNIHNGIDMSHALFSIFYNNNINIVLYHKISICDNQFKSYIMHSTNENLIYFFINLIARDVIEGKKEYFYEMKVHGPNIYEKQLDGSDLFFFYNEKT